ncbi:g567 [Coccomyxa elongata]
MGCPPRQEIRDRRKESERRFQVWLSNRDYARDHNSRKRSYQLDMRSKRRQSPVNPLKRELWRHCKVVSMDEHLTSKLCQFCGPRSQKAALPPQRDPGWATRQSLVPKFEGVHCTPSN